MLMCQSFIDKEFHSRRMRRIRGVVGLSRALTLRMTEICQGFERDRVGFVARHRPLAPDDGYQESGQHRGVT